MTRFVRCAAAALLLLTQRPASLAGQAGGWSLGVSTAYSDFRGGLRDPSGITFEPSSRFNFALEAARTFEKWELQFGLGWAAGHLSSRDSTGEALQIDALDAGFDRLRGSVSFGIRLAGVGEGKLSLLAGPTFDLWHGDDKWRPRLGGEARLALTAPLGKLCLENYLGYSLSGSPFNADEFPAEFERTALNAISVGIALRWKL
ncbi:MAG TPA: hypothetical protein VMJ30_09630 [Gemmatimonadales bacterium]|nr:hypothetical protein [Gemmatimonadales bacterium]